MSDDYFSALESMIYSGRGIAVGMTPSRKPFMGYSLTGRSDPSKARELVEGKNTRTIRTNVTDKEQLEKGSPALLLYPAIVPVKHRDMIVASNGAQTQLVYSAAMRRPLDYSPYKILKDAFKEPFWLYDEKENRWIDITTYEPDPPNNTPRISACMQGNSAAFHIVLCSDSEQGYKREKLHLVDLVPGRGKMITTYKGGNEKPLQPFTGEPLDISIASETAEGIAESMYSAIGHGSKPGENYRVAAAVMVWDPKTWSIDTKIINRSERGE